MKRWGVPFLFPVLLIHGLCNAEVVTRLPDNDDKVIALTFDACETRTPSFLDQRIVAYLLEEGVPFTVFVSGKFAKHNADALRALVQNPIVELENHSMNHRQHMEGLEKNEVIREVVECEQLLTDITGRTPFFFRFPAGNYDQRTLRIIEGLGYQVVHWTFASGDPDKRITPKRLSTWILGRARPGNILIFHINGRGYSTGEALPKIVQELRQRGYRFALLREVITSPGQIY